MKQLYYTSCRTGKSLGGSSGFQIRAVSPGVAGDQLRLAVRYASYSLPPSVMPTDKTKDTAPVRLALLKTREIGKVLCHCVYVGQDPMTGRYGNFFAHLILNLPEEFDALRAIQTWGNPFWRREDDDSDSQLEELEEVPGNGNLHDDILAQFLAQSAHQQMVKFVLEGVLDTDPTYRVFLAAPAQSVALCVYAVTRVLPSILLEEFTFSTYEPDPLACGARLVGSWFGDGAENDLPSSCYSGSCVAFNTYTGRQSPLSTASPFIGFALKAMSSSEGLQKLDQFRANCEQLQVDSSQLIDLVYRLHAKDAMERITPEDALIVLEHARLSEWVFRRPYAPRFLEKIVLWAKADAHFYEQVLPCLGKLLTEDEEIESRLFGDLPTEARQRLRGWTALYTYARNPSFAGAGLQLIADELSQEPANLKIKNFTKVTQTVRKALREKAAECDVSPQLRNILFVLGPCYPGGAVSLYRSILKCYLEGDDKFWRLTHLLHALIATGLDSNYDLEKIVDPEPLEDDVKVLITQIGRRGGKKSIGAINYQVRDWESLKAKKSWRRLAKKWLRNPSSMFFKVGVVAVCLVVALLIEELTVGALAVADLFQNSASKKAEPSTSQGGEPKDSEKKGDETPTKGKIAQDPPSEDSTK